MKNILVTGGAGFIGSYLVEELLRNNYQVYVIDDLRNRGGIVYVNPKAKFIKGNITDKKIYKQLSKFKIDIVYHLAAQSASETAYDDIKFDILTNIYGSYLIANFCLENKINKLIYSSSVAVYGSSLNKVKESKIKKPDSIYGVSKFSGELIIKQTLKNTPTNYTIFRLFNVYGPGENLNFIKKGIVSIYLSYVWKKQPIIIKGNIGRFRDFIFIDDVIEAFIIAINTKNSINKTYNLGYGKKTSVKELLKIIFKVFKLKKDYKLEILEETPGDSFSFYSDISKIKSDLKWKPKYSLLKGIKEYHKWIKKVPVKKNLENFHPLKLKKKNYN